VDRPTGRTLRVVHAAHRRATRDAHAAYDAGFAVKELAIAPRAMGLRDDARLRRSRPDTGGAIAAADRALAAVEVETA